MTIAAADVGQAQAVALADYQACVTSKTQQFRRSDLSGDKPEIIIYAAEYTCSSERAELIEKTKMFVHARHPDLTLGSLGKVTALFVEGKDSELEQQLVAELGER